MYKNCPARPVTTKLMKLTTLLICFICIENSIHAQSIILGRPTDVSITASILFDYNAQYYLKFGSQPGVYTDSTAIISNTANIPDEPEMTNLFPDTKYYYRLCYRPSGGSAYSVTPEYSFHTQRAQGSTFTFTIEADEHLYDIKGVKSMYQVTLNNEAKDHPDFMISLGDIFGDDHTPSTTTLADMDSLHKGYLPFLGTICHSTPFYVCLGNHEGEMDYYLDSMPPNNIGVYGTLSRKKYYPNPYPNNFYSGDTIVEGYGMGQPENYYSWTWGNALFVVLDVYRDQCDTSPKPHNWDWSLGLPQYNWLQNTLQNSTSQYKFVFAHHIRGENRGGITNATQYEWGGYQNTNYTFPANRPGWAMPIHQLFVTYGVNVFFQGHDHLFAHEELDSVTYQEVPMAADSTYKIGMLANASAYTADTLEGTGHLRVTVSPSCVTVDFVRAYLPADTLSGLHHNGEVAFSYSVGNCSTTGTNELNEKELIKVYPNPAKNRLKVYMPDESDIFRINLLNTYGQSVLKTQTSEIDVSKIPNGVYFLNIETEKFTATKKIIINN